MDSLGAAGDGAVLKSADYGAIVLLQNAGTNGVDTYRFTKTEWDTIYNADDKNNAIVTEITTNQTAKK